MVLAPQCRPARESPRKETQMLAGGSHDIREVSGAQIASSAPSMKPMDADSILCLAVHKGKRRCCILSLVCETLDQNSFITVCCRSGMSDSLRPHGL